MLLLNKIDKSNQEQLEEQVDFWKEKVPNATVIPISALENFCPNIKPDENNNRMANFLI